VKLDANSAAILRKISPEDLRKRVNDALGSRINLLGNAPRVIAAKQLKSGDVVLHTATTAEADTLKSTEEERVKVLGTTARVIKPTYGVVVHGLRTDKESIDTVWWRMKSEHCIQPSYPQYLQLLHYHFHVRRSSSQR
jgi:hypothetical protein